LHLASFLEADIFNSTMWIVNSGGSSKDRLG